MAETQPKKKRFDMSTLVMLALFALCVALFTLTSGERLAHLFKPLFVFLRMASIVGIIGIPSFYIGESLPRSMYDPEHFPFRCCAWEKNGLVYEKLGIRWLKTHTLDMSRMMGRVFPKQHTMSRNPAHLRRLVLEMCNAELIHWILTLLSPVFACLIEGWHGVVISCGYALGNLSYVMIQRYNRPALSGLEERLRRREARKAEKRLTAAEGEVANANESPDPVG